MSTLYAYLDAGSASAIVSLILGGAAAIGVALRYRWSQLLRFLGIRKPQEPEEPSVTTTTAEPAEREPVNTK